jgi:hypothetical protein
MCADARKAVFLPAAGARFGQRANRIALIPHGRSLPQGTESRLRQN